MAPAFDYFVIFSEMRTGSNLLEATLSQVDGLQCHGEVFNPDHMGGPSVKEVLGLTMTERLRDPIALLERVRNAPGLNGIRFFFDHEPRVVDAILNDPRCAKIVLTRNPVDCYISLKIAYNTKRWQLTDVKDRIVWKPPFKPAEFETFLAERQAFQLRILNALQVSGQTAFYLDYEDSLEVGVINGLLKYLGSDDRIERISDDLVRQNPEEMADKVRNFPEMEVALQKIDWASLARTPNFEPRRGPGVPRMIAAADAPLLYIPIRSANDAHIRDWLSRLGAGGLIEDFNQKTLRAWKRKTPGHRSFTVLRHPLVRANDAFCAVLKSDAFADIRPVLRRHYEVPIPADDEVDLMGAGAHHAALLAFLRFVRVNLSGQTTLRQDVAWASQWAILQGIGQFAAPDLLCREDSLAQDLTYLTKSVGIKSARPADAEAPAFLEEIYDAELEDAARDAYPRDFMTYGFTKWKPGR